MTARTCIAIAIVIGLGCGSSEKAEEAPAGESSSGAESTQPDTLKGHMAANFYVAIQARDGVIAGSLIQAKEAAVKLAEQDYTTVLPPDWMPGVQRMQDAARQLANVEDVQSAANGVAALAATCGECHASGKVKGARGGVVPPDLNFGAAEDMKARMQRHQRAASGFWYGLTVPNDAAWNSAAQALLDAPMTPVDAQGKAVDAATVAKVEKVREIAKRSLNVTDVGERTKLYAEFLGTCAHCHSGK
jgi:mono/diheme cytochrome c family protein